VSRLIALYPARWRDRYEDEFLALLAERPPRSVGERLDIVRGAIDARVHPQLPGTVRVRDRAGYAVLLGFVAFWAGIGIAANGPIHYDTYGSYRDGAAGLPFLVLAMVLLSVGLYRIIVRLPLTARGSPLAGTIAIITGPCWGFMPWFMPAGLAFVVGTFGLIAGARQARVLPIWSAGLAALSLVVPATLFAAMLFLPWYALRTSGIEGVVIIAPLSLLWPAIGGALVRGFAPSADAPNPA
jgi:hypothetical protein